MMPTWAAPPRTAADQGEGEIVEKAAAAGRIQRDAENDEADDNFGEGPHRDAEGGIPTSEVIGERVAGTIADCR